MAAFSIRLVGDPVLTQRASAITDIDGKVAKLASGMAKTLWATDNGVAIAAPQVGALKRLFVYEVDDEPVALINPEIRESTGEATYQEGCLSIPGLYFDIVRPAEVLVVGYDLDGNELEIEADGFTARMFQHEIDHLDGVLMTEHLDEDQRKEAKKALREMRLAAMGAEGARPDGLRLP